MKDLIIPVNNEAMSRALIAIAGEEKTVVILEAYRLIDAAMVFGYQKGLNEGAEDRATAAKEYVEALQRSEASGFSQAWSTGYDEGRADGVDISTDVTAYQAGFQAAVDKIGFAPAEQERYDDGYVDGVSDARSFPDFADDQVSLLCAADEHYDDWVGAENEYDFEAWSDDSDFVKTNAHVEGECWYTKEEMDAAGISYDEASHARNKSSTEGTY